MFAVSLALLRFKQSLFESLYIFHHCYFTLLQVASRLDRCVYEAGSKRATRCRLRSFVSTDDCIQMSPIGSQEQRHGDVLKN